MILQEVCYQIQPLQLYLMLNKIIMNPVYKNIRRSKRTIFLLIGIISSQVLFAQKASRKVINFNHGWEMYCVKIQTVKM